MAIRQPQNGMRNIIEDMTHNPFYENFGNFRKSDTERKREAKQNQIGQSEDSIASLNGNGSVVVYNYGNKDPLSRRKDVADKLVAQWHDELKHRYANYCRIEKRPEVRYVLETICDEAVVGNHDDQICSLQINENFPDIAIGKATKVHLQQDFNNIMQTLLRVDDNLWKWFKKFLIEGSLFLEVGYSRKMDKVTGVRVLPSYNMLVLVEDGEVIGYRQIIDKTAHDTDRTYATYYTMGGDLSKDWIDYHPNQILWWDYDERGFDGINDRLSFLENARKVANQLKNIEDSIVRYRILRGHEKRVFYIATKNMPPQKAEEHLRRQAENLNRKLYYNTDDGTIVGLERIQSMVEDYYFAQPDGETPSKIDTLAAGANLGEITDLNYFKMLLYQALLFPASRSVSMAGTNNGTVSLGKPGEITRDEIVLTRFIERIQRTFSSQVAIPLFIMFLETSEKYDQSIKDEKFFTCKFTQSNLFKIFKEAEVLNTKLDVLSKAAQYIDDGTDSPNSIFAKEYVLKHMFQMTDEEWAKNETLKSLERLERIRNNVKKEEIDKENMDLTNPGDMTGDAGGGQFADIDTAVNGMGGEPDELPTEDLELPSNEELSGEAPATPETPAI